MNRSTLVIALSLVPARVFAATVEIPQKVKTLIGVFSTTILNPLIAIMFALSLAVFMYGIVLYIWQPENEGAREEGRRSMIWGVVGMFVMVSVFGIIRFLISSIGADNIVIDNV